MIDAVDDVFKMVKAWKENHDQPLFLYFALYIHMDGNWYLNVDENHIFVPQAL